MAFEPYVGVTLLVTSTGMVHIPVDHNSTTDRYFTYCKRWMRAREVRNEISHKNVTCPKCRLRDGSLGLWMYGV